MSIVIPDRFSRTLREPATDTHFLGDDGTYPNNEELPVLVYKQVLRNSVDSSAGTFERVFRRHGWTGTWRNGIFSYHHYHSTAHEVLGVAEGSATVQLGGPTGVTVEVSRGDVLILPAGVAHKNLNSTSNFLVVGAYPEGQDWDLKRGAPADRPQADRHIEAVPLPTRDPVYGANGLLRSHWHKST